MTDSMELAAADLFPDPQPVNTRPGLADRLIAEADRLHEISTRWQTSHKAEREADLREAAAILKAKAQGGGE